MREPSVSKTFRMAGGSRRATSTMVRATLPAPRAQPCQARCRHTSAVPGQAYAAEDLPPDGEVPVAKGWPDGARRYRPGSATQNAEVATEERLAVSRVEHRREARPRFEAGRRPFPDVTD